MRDVDVEEKGCQAVADTGQFGGGDATSICSEPNASQDPIA